MPDRHSRPSTSQKTLTTLLTLIVEGKLLPGTRLTETELAHRLHVSRTPIRTAVANLLTMGLLGRQASHALCITPFSFEDAVEVLFLREELEGFAVRLAGHLIPRERLLQLQREMASSPGKRRSGGARAHTRFDQGTRFHDVLAQAPTSPLLRQLFQLVRPHALRERYYAREI